MNVLVSLLKDNEIKQVLRKTRHNCSLWKVQNHKPWLEGRDSKNQIAISIVDGGRLECQDVAPARGTHTEVLARQGFTISVLMDRMTRARSSIFTRHGSSKDS
jgi:hypothetical protein